jgi:plastocyanin
MSRTLVVACVLLALGGRPARAACNDAAAVAAVRAAAEAACPCAAATSHARYVRCVAAVIRGVVAGRGLPKPCRRTALACARRSTCGEPGAVACCRTNARGKTRCTIGPAARCHAQKGGSACTRDVASCCDACPAGACVGTTTTTVTATTSTTRTTPSLPSATTTTAVGSTSTTTAPGPEVHTVMVGNAGFNFDPPALAIHVGDTVHWMWASSGHNVVSGAGGTADGRFCSPTDTTCAATPTSSAGATYDHTFSAPGTFPYFCSIHYPLMTGTIDVQ